MTDRSGAGRRALVTGATRGIGLAVASRLARDGFDIVANYRGDDNVAAAAKAELEAIGRTIVMNKGDVSNADEAGALIETALSELGQLDVLVNNAGITRDTLIMRMSEDDWDAVLTTNLKGAFLCSKAAIRPMIRQRSGRGQAFLRRFVVVQREADLLDVIRATDPPGRLAGLLDSGQQERDQDPDNGNDHQQLDEREACGGGFHHPMVISCARYLANPWRRVHVEPQKQKSPKNFG